MRDRTVIVTGANSGMGLATTVELARLGAHVIMACRSRERGEQALQEAQRQSGSDRLRLMQLDLGSLASVRAFAAAFDEQHDTLDALINNAGVVAIKRQTTADGFEAMMGVNHLGHFLLTNLLLKPLLRSPQGRIVTVSSGAHKIGNIHFDDPHLTKGYSVWKGYAQSKLANILFTKELAERLKGTKATANSLHPGAVGTNLGVDRATGFGSRIHAFAAAVFPDPGGGRPHDRLPRFESGGKLHQRRILLPQTDCAGIGPGPRHGACPQAMGLERARGWAVRRYGGSALTFIRAVFGRTRMSGSPSGFPLPERCSE